MVDSVVVGTFKTVQVKNGDELFWRKNGQKNERWFLRPDHCWLQVLNSAKPIFFCYDINRKDMTCHESKISLFEYVR